MGISSEQECVIALATTTYISIIWIHEPFTMKTSLSLKNEMRTKRIPDPWTRISVYFVAEFSAYYYFIPKSLCVILKQMPGVMGNA